MSAGVLQAGVDLFREAVDKDDLRGAVLPQADLWEANLTGANLSSADLSKANLGRAILTGADLADADLTLTVLGEATWIDGRICATGSVGECR